MSNYKAKIVKLKSVRNPLASDFLQIAKDDDTDQLKRSMRDVRDIPEGARLILTSKRHGSSGRLGFLPREQKPTFWQKLLNRKPDSKYQHVIGSSNMIQGIAEDFNGERFRLDSVQHLIG